MIVSLVLGVGRAKFRAERGLGRGGQSAQPPDVTTRFTIFINFQPTTTVTLKVLGTARNALLVVASVYLFAEMVSPIQFLG